jgi:uncharacterized protein (TIGR04222 family)
MNLNPFDLRGPQFLVFYGTLAVMLLILLWLWRRRAESGDEGEEWAWAKKIAKDPYETAFLRGGRDEVIRIAVVSLVERGLLKADGINLHTVATDAADKARRPLDRAILTMFVRPMEAKQLYSDRTVLGEADVLGQPLKDNGLLAVGQVVVARVMAAIVCIGVLWGIAAIKIAVALGRGHHNIIFLILVAFGSAIEALLLSGGKRTILGNKTLSHLQAMFHALKARKESVHMDGRQGETAFLAAVFGMTVLPAATMGLFEPLHLGPPRREQGWGNTGTSCGGSSCGGSSCGGGGGGCGGGCGGCGGCG